MTKTEAQSYAQRKIASARPEELSIYIIGINNRQYADENGDTSDNWHVFTESVGMLSKPQAPIFWVRFLGLNIPKQFDPETLNTEQAISTCYDATNARKIELLNVPQQFMHAVPEVPKKTTK